MKFIRQHVLVFVVGAILCVGGGFVVYQKKWAPFDFTSLVQKQLTDDDKQRIVQVVSRVVELPRNEIPEINFVTKLDRLKTQSFFAQAQTGDVVLIYRQAKKAFLYRSTTHRLVNQATVVLVSQPPDDTLLPDGAIPGFALPGMH